MKLKNYITIYLLLLTVSLALSTGPVCAQKRPATSKGTQTNSSPNKNAGKFKITGLVIDENGDPMPGVVVYQDESNLKKTSAVTDTDGRSKQSCHSIFHGLQEKNFTPQQ